MWILQNVYNNDCFGIVSEKLKYTIGRMGADIELLNDNSVSRSHAQISLTSSQTESTTFELTIQDLGSKYGTYVNDDIRADRRLPINKCVPLKSKDVIRFGRLKSVWKMQYYEINVSMSSLTNEDQNEMKGLIKYLDGTILENWTNECTHLTINTPSVTGKLLQAVVEQKEVVTIDYWKELFKCVKGGKFTMIKAENYRPVFMERFNLNCQLERRVLFKGYTFVFLHRKHYDVYGRIVCAAGGSYKELTVGIPKTFLLKNNVIVIKYLPSNQSQSSQTIARIVEYLHNHSKRAIPEYEIGLAILYCSTERFCNPSYCFMGSTNLEENTDMDIAIPETDPSSQSQKPCQISNVIVETNTKKRKHSVSKELIDSDDNSEVFGNFTKRICDRRSPEESAKTIETRKSVENTEINLPRSESTAKYVHRDDEPFKEFQENVNDNTKQIRKKTFVPILGDDANECLFDFGDKLSSTEKNQQANDLNKGLFNFSDDCPDAHKVSADKSNDMEPTEQYIPTITKCAQKPNQIIVKKPCKVRIGNWLSCSVKTDYSKSVKKALDESNHKHEASFSKEASAVQNIKPENADEEWIKSLENAMQVKSTSMIKDKKTTDMSYYKYKNNPGNLHQFDGAMKNFKAFVKKYRPPQRAVTIIQLHSRIV